MEVLGTILAFVVRHKIISGVIWILLTGVVYSFFDQKHKDDNKADLFDRCVSAGQYWNNRNDRMRKDMKSDRRSDILILIGVIWIVIGIIQLIIS